MGKRRRSKRTAWPLALAAAVVAPAAQVASWLFSRPTMPHPLDAPRRTIETRAGALASYEDDGGRGNPVLLLHSTGPAGCAYELHGLFEALRGERPLVAVELPGYGSSTEAAARLSEVALTTVVEELVAQLGLRFGETVDVVAFGRTGLAAAQAAARIPKQVRSLVLVSPPATAAGFVGRKLEKVTSPLRRAGAALLGAPGIGAAVHRVATTRPALEIALARRSAEVPRALLHHAWFAARQPCAHRAQLESLRAALRGGADASTFAACKVPMLVVLGEGEVPDGVLRSPLAVPGRTLAVVPQTKALPHVERPFETAAAMRAFWLGMRPKPALRLVRGQGLGRAMTTTPRPALRDVAPDSVRRR